MADLRKANEVKEKYVNQLKKLPDVIGVGVTGSEHDARIVVFVLRVRKDLTQKLPKVLDGVPVEVLETGRIEAR
ncbi:MAG TPA: hypothetical protein VIH03_03770 [Nitrososphaerales archaeon]